MKRPAAAQGPAGGSQLQDLSLEEVSRLGFVNLVGAEYYHRPVEVCGRVVGSRSEEGESYMDMVVSGTRDEELLRVLSGDDERRLVVHICQAGCGGVLSSPNLVHGKGYVKGDKKAAPWMTNLEAGAEEEDENRRLREEADEHRRREGRSRSPRGKTEKEKDKEKKRDKKDKGKKEKGKKEKKKGKKETKKKEEAPVDVSSSSSDLEVGQRPLEDIFEGTGLDPNVKRRRRLLKRAKRVGKSKKKKSKKKGSQSSGSQSGGDTTSTTSTAEEEEGNSLFAKERKLKRIWQRYPGCLASSMISEAKNALVTAAGTSWAVDKHSLPPVVTQYVRQTVMPTMGAPMAQEVLTIAQALDMMLVGRIGACADLLGQRLKALESLGRGNHWTVARQHELVRVENQGLADDAEHREAAARAREDDKLRGMLTRQSQGSKGDSQGKGKKGKESKGGGKYRSDEGPRGKGGGDGKKEDQKQTWQRKDK